MTDQAVEQATRQEAAQIVATFVRGGAGDGPADVARKIRNVALFAGTDDMLPVLESVRISADDGDKLTMEATDRFGLGEETVTLPEPVVAAFNIMVDARALVAAVKATVPARGTFLILRRETDALILDNGEGGTVRLPRVEGSFPRTASLWPAATSDEGVTAYGLSRPQLARLGKIDTGSRSTMGNGSDPVRFTFDKPARACVVHIGETFRALVMPVRLDN